jgi:hypothetical protein
MSSPETNSKNWSGTGQLRGGRGGIAFLIAAIRQSQPRRGDIFVETTAHKTKLRRSDISPPMPPLRGFGDSNSRFYKDSTPTEFAENRTS